MQEGASAIHVVGDGSHPGEAEDVVLELGCAVRLDYRDEVLGLERAVDRAGEGAPHHSTEGRVLVDARVHDGVLAAGESSGGSVAEAQNKVDVPGEQHGFPAGLPVQVHVLSDVVGPGVPVAGDTMEREDMHPLIHVGLL